MNYYNLPLARLTIGTVSLSQFAWVCKVPSSAITQVIDGERIEIAETVWRGRVCRYLTPEQQCLALAFWDRHNVRHRKPARNNDGQSNPKRPLYQI